MAIVPKIFTGRLDLDSSPHLVEKGDYIYALNITRNQGTSAFNDDVVIGFVRGNRFVPYNLPGGTNKVIGCKADPLRSCVYYFIFNSGNYHTIARYNNSTRSIITVFQNITDTGNENIWELDINYKIINVDIIHRDEGDLLMWVDPVPRKINVTKAINKEYSPATVSEILVAKAPPLYPPGTLYVSDANVLINNVNKNLFQFGYRYIYADFEKSTFSPLSISPLREYDYLTSINPNSNNAITVTVNTGVKEISKVEIIMRYNIGNIYSDYYLVNTIDKEALGLNDNLEYSFNFANDSVYPAIDVNEAIQTFDWVPREANAQCLVNGNVLVYGGILEGYNNLPVNELNVVTNVTYETIILPSGNIIIGNPTFTSEFIQSGFPPNVVRTNCTVGANITPGDIFNVVFTVSRVPGTLGDPICFTPPSGDHSFSYTAQLGDIQQDIVDYFVGQLNPIADILAIDDGGGAFHFQTSPTSCYRLVNITISAFPATSSATGDFFDRIYKAGGKFRFGIVYFDAEGRTPGVQTYVTAPGNTNDFEVDIQNFSAFDTAYSRPVVSLTVNHLPPSWAKSFSFVRSKNIVTTSYFMWKCDDVQDDGSFFYFGIDNLEAFVADNPNFTSAWTFATGDRLKASYQANVANPTGWGAIYSPVLDFEIVGVVEYNGGGGAQTYIKVRKYPGTILPNPYDERLVFEVYRPAPKTTASNLLYYEFGETYPCVIVDGINYHQGQDATTNPTFQFRDGDSYIRIRAGTGDSYLILDPNYSDYSVSSVYSDGRPFIQDENAGETYNPTLVRFGQTYQFGTNINDLNRFYFENFDEYSRSYGDILKLDYYASYMKVGQKLRIGNVPVELQIIKTANGDNALTTSDRLLNTIVYYQGDFGIGTCPESWARNNFVVYGCDNIRNVVWRLSQDGLTILSILYKVSSWAISQLPLRVGNSKIYGVYNAAVDRYEIALEEAPDLDILAVNISEKFGYSGTFQLAINIEDICDAPYKTLYMGEPFGIGVIMYTVPTFLFNVTEQNYIADAEGNIYEMNSTTGEVGALTAFTCNSGISGLYRLAVLIGDVCDATPQTLYADVAFGTGAFLFYDSSLATEVTGFNFVVAITGEIYNLDSTTGEVLTSTSTVCSNLTVSNTTNLFQVTIDDVQFSTGGGTITIATPITPGNSEDGTFTENTGILQLTLSSAEVSGEWNANLTVNGSFIECVYITNPNTTASFSSRTYEEDDEVTVTLNEGACM